MKKLIIENPEQFQNHFSRSAVFTREKVEGKEGYRNVIATENPALVMDWYRWEVIREVLLMNGCQIPANRQLVLLDNHTRFDTTCIKGSTREVEIVGNELVGMTLISKTAEREGILVDEGHLTDTSIGYQVLERTIIKPGESAVINGRTFENNYGDNLDLQIVTKWRPFENSLTPIGADQAAKFRSQFAPKTETGDRKPETVERQKLEIDSKLNLEEIITKINERSSNLEISIIKENNPMGDTMTPEERKKLLDDDAARRSAIIGVIDKTKNQANFKGIDVEVEAREFLNDPDKTDLDFQAHLFKRLQAAAPSRSANGQLGLTESEVQRFSLRKLIASQIPGEKVDAGFELECSREYAKSIGRSPKGFFVPPDINGKRLLVTSTDSAGGFLKGTDHRYQDFVEMARNRMVTAALGVVELPGLVEDIEIPVQTGSQALEFLANEDSAATGGDMTFSQLTGSPKVGSSNTIFSRKLLLQGLPSIEELIDKDMMMRVALGKDFAIIAGAGGSAPEGIISQATGSEDGTDFAYANAVNMETDVAAANLDVANMHYLTNASIRGLLKQRPVVSGQPIFLIGPDGKMNGYNVAVSNQVPTGKILFGDFSQVVVPLWGGYDVVIDPYSLSTKGQVRVSVFVAMDVILKQPAAFSIAESVS